MFELFARLAIIGSAVGIALACRGGDPLFAAEVAGGLAALDIFSFLLERRGLKSANASAIIAGLEVAGIALWLADAGELSRFGPLVLGPLLWATTRQGVQASVLAPIAAASLIAANTL